MNKQIFIDKGKLITKEVPKSTCRQGEVIVDVLYSAFSSGTEFGEIIKSSKSLLERARQSPEKIGKALEMVKTTGLKNTINFVQDSQLALTATGYSAAGVVSSVGKGINDLAVGDMVACAGAQYAHHASQVKVSKQLCAKLPYGLSPSLASTVTLGSIAMQGLRQAEISLGEKVAVIGLGVIGQITCQLLLAAGTNVTGLDLDEKKLLLASECGVQNTLNVKNNDFLERGLELTDGHGYDKVLICASDTSSSSVKTAFELARHRATVVMIGGIGLDLDRKLMYYKELNFVASMSYGQGRYERDYEEKGLDLPIAYVRWTENRNMLSYLEVINNRQKNFENLIGNIIDFNEAEKYLNSDKSKNLEKPLIIIKYSKLEETSQINPDPSKRRVTVDKNISNVGLVGAGGFAKNFILPNINLVKNANISVLASSDTASLVNMKDKYNIQRCVSNIDEALEEDITGIFIANRHSEHFISLKKSFRKGKSVFIEKPTINTVNELDELIKLLEDPDYENLLIYTGYNRAYSPHIRFIKDELKHINSPVMLSYQMNAGLLKKDNWQYDVEEGGRNIGEAVHIYHLFGILFESKVTSLSVSSINGNELYKPGDNFIATLRYENGCVGTLNYSSLGSSAYPKESLIIHSGGKTIKSENYKKTQVVGGKSFNTSLSEKGHKEVIESFFNSLATGTSYMSRAEQVETMRIAFSVESELRGD